MAERLRALFLNNSIISPLCLVRAPLWPLVRQAKFCLRVCQMVFLWVLPFSPHLLGASENTTCSTKSNGMHAYFKISNETDIHLIFCTYRSKQGSCLQNTPTTVVFSHNLWAQPPGKMMDEDMQCQIAFGQSYEFCDVSSDGFLLNNI